MVVVLDTNVLVVAVGGHSGAGQPCEDRCAACVRQVLASGRIAVDRDGEILREYRRQFPRGRRGAEIPGRLDQMRRTGRIESKECGWDAPGVARVPEALQCLDPSDRKFAAVALAYTPPVPVLNAVDPDWWQCAEACAAVGLVVEELCPEALEQGT